MKRLTFERIPNSQSGDYRVLYGGEVIGFVRKDPSRYGSGRRVDWAYRLTWSAWIGVAATREEAARRLHREAEAEDARRKGHARRRR